MALAFLKPAGAIDLIDELEEHFHFEQGGASSSTNIVPPHTVQVETIFYEQLAQRNSPDISNTGATLFRYGLIKDKLEARAGYSGFSFMDGEFSVAYANLGTKINFLKQSDYLPEIDMIANFHIPFKNDFLGENFIHSYNFLIDYVFGKLVAYTNIGSDFINGERNGPGNYNFMEIPYVYGLGYDLTEKLSISGEVYGTWALSGGRGNQLGLASTASYAIADNTAITLTGLWGLNNPSDPFLFNLGLVHRF